MTTTATDAAPSAISVEKALAGILAVLVADRDDRLTQRDPRSTDVVLADAGLSYGEVAQLTGRPYETVKSAVRRSRTPAKEPA